MNIGYTWIYQISKLGYEHGTRLLVSSLIFKDGRGWIGGIAILACCKFHFIKEHENLGYNPQCARLHCKVESLFSLGSEQRCVQAASRHQN